MTTTRDDYTISDEHETFDVPAIAALLHDTYWAAQRHYDDIAISLLHSTCLSLTHLGKTIGFVRALTDYSVNSYICDFIIAKDHRGQELGTWMLQVLMEHPSLVRTNQFLLTKDAMAFYEKHGFAQHPYTCMKRPRRVEE